MPLVYSLTAAGQEALTAASDEAKLPVDYLRLLGMIEVRARILKSAYPGDTLFPLLEIVDLKPQRTTGVVTKRATVTNQRGETILDGEHTYLLRL